MFFISEPHVHQAIRSGGSGLCRLVVQNHGPQPAQYSHPRHWVNRSPPHCPGIPLGLACIHIKILHLHIHKPSHTLALFSSSSWVNLKHFGLPVHLFLHQQQGQQLSHCTVRPQLHHASVKSSHNLTFPQCYRRCKSTEGLPVCQLKLHWLTNFFVLLNILY